MLDRALVVSGTLSWQGGDHLSRDVSAPYKEHTVIADGKVAMTRQGHGTRHFSLDRAPPLKALLDSLVAVLSGNPQRLQKGFSARLDGDATHSWTLTLRPDSARLAKGLSHIRLDGHGDTLDCMEIAQSGGTVTIDLLGPLAARMPKQPNRAQLTGLCRRAH